MSEEKEKEKDFGCLIIIVILLLLILIDTASINNRLIEVQQDTQAIKRSIK